MDWNPTGTSTAYPGRIYIHRALQFVVHFWGVQYGYDGTHFGQDYASGDIPQFGTIVRLLHNGSMEVGQRRADRCIALPNCQYSVYGIGGGIKNFELRIKD